MSQSRLIPLIYYDPGKEVRLTVYADTIILDPIGADSIISAVRFGGYPEMVKAMSDAIYGGATLEMPLNGQTRQLKAIPKQYRRQMSHDGQYAVGTLMVNDDPQAADFPDDEDESDEAGEQQTIQTQKCYIFVPAGVAVEVYATTLHYAPCHVNEAEGFRVAVVLPRGTNTAAPGAVPLNREDKWLTARNKWLLAHPESSEAAQGAHVGLKGASIDISNEI